MEKKPSHKKAVIIDFIIIMTFAFIVVNILRITYNIYQYPRYVSALVILCCIPITWGTLIMSLMKKNTPGHIIAAKVAQKKNNQDKTQ